MARLDSLLIRKGLSEAEASIYIGIGVTKFRELVMSKIMPKPRCIGSRRLWDVVELDLAFADLPREGEEEVNSWADFRGGDTIKTR